MRKSYLGCASAALGTLLSGCGGGGESHVVLAPPPLPSSAVNIPKPVTTPTTENFETNEYLESLQARVSNVIPAWQAGANGAGIKIGIVDTGIDTNHPDFVGRIDPASSDFGGSGTLADEYGHGTAVASLAAAGHNDRTVEGIAYDATIIMEKVAPAGCSASNCFMNLQAIAMGISAAAAAGARVINLSLGGQVNSDIVNAVREAAKAGVIFVVSAGNAKDDKPDPFARAVANAAPGQTVIVGALGQAGPNVIEHYGEGIDWNQLLDISNRAGSFQSSYVGAPALYVRVDAPGLPDGIDAVSGTSFAAPAVAGTIALMLQAFPNLTPQELVQILLTTADDLGASGVDSTFGHGRLNVGRAFMPIGETALAGRAIKVSVVDNGSAPAAVGDALDRGSLRAVVLDAYQRAFTVNLARTLQNAPSGRPLASAISASVQNTAFSVGPMGVAVNLTPQSVNRSLGFATAGVGPHSDSIRPMDASFVAQLGHGISGGMSISSGSRGLVRRLDDAGPPSFLINQDILSTAGFNSRSSKSFALRKTFGSVGVNAVQEAGDVPKSHAGDAAAHYRLSTLGIDQRIGAATLFMSVSRLDEDKTLLGGRLGAVFGAAGAKTIFVDGQVAGRLGERWYLSGSARHGWTKFAAGAFTTAGYSLTLVRTGVWQSDDNLSFLLTQPLRVEAGGLSMMLPGSYDYANSTAAYDRTRMSLRPKGRELAGEIGYARGLGFGSAGLNVYARRQPGHFATAAPDIGAAVQFRLKL